jgi:hypothetical protein
MNKIVLLLLPVALLAADQKKKPAGKPVPVADLLRQGSPAAAEPGVKPAPADKPAPAAKPAPAEKPAPAVIPADAELIAPATWRHLDKSGKSWIYRKTPFGLSRVEEMQAPPPGAAPAMNVKVTDLGDTVRFERPTPMGNGVWVKKKSDLTAEEKVLVDKSAGKPAEK